MPASRRARAITLAPRSCPSRPGFAMTTRSLRMSVVSSQGSVASGQPGNWPLATGHWPLQPSYDWDFLVLAPHVAKRVADLADRGVGADRIDDRRHQVRGGPCRGPKRIERSDDRVVVARLLEFFELRQLRAGGGLVDVEDLDRRLVLLHEVVDADDDFLLPLDGLLEAVGALGDLLLREPALDRLDHPAHLVDGGEVGERAVLHLIREPLHEIRAAQRV